MRFAVLDSHFQNCEAHLVATNSVSTHVESYLVQFLLTRICAEYETRIKVLIQRRCTRVTDGYVRHFAERSAKDVSKNFNIGDLKGVLARFGDDYKQGFHDSVMLTPAHIAWDNIYANRQAVAHGSGAQMTFKELKTAYEDSLGVLDSLMQALELTPLETVDLT
ncbi:HEPN domain-containing protein [Candidatus Binatus sp.]|jgi:hypothetical protein|uniref:HEPN domain-containing protein n=1 Tax=Candidatus Binatus sp. TaxID=2811406 RepID=UPI003BE4257C